MSMKKNDEKDLDILSSSIKEDDSKDEKKAAKNVAKLEKKKAKAKAKREKYDVKIRELRTQIADEKDDAKKATLIAKRDELVKQRDSISATSTTSASTKKTIRIVAIVIIVIGLLVVYFMSGTVRNGILAQASIPQKALTAITIVDKDGDSHAIKVSTYNFYFSNLYNNIKSQQQMITQSQLNLKDFNLDVNLDEKLDDQIFTEEDGTKITWSEHLKNEVIDSIKSTYIYYFEAVEANGGKEPELKEEQKQQIDDNIKQYEEAAKSNGYALDAFLNVVMGKGMNEKALRHELAVSFISENYKAELTEKFAKDTYKPEQFEQYKKDHALELETIDAYIFECTNEDDAKAFAKALNNDGSNFNQLAAKYTKDNFVQSALQTEPNWALAKGVTRDYLKQNKYAVGTADQKAMQNHKHAEGEEHNDNEKGMYPGLDYLFSSNRNANEIYQYSTTVVFLVRPASITDVKPVNVRHILINPVVTEDPNFQQTKATSEQWNSAFKKATELLNGYKNGEKTPDAFGEIAKKESKDPGSAAKGGLYENVMPGTMVPTFNAWCFDENRKPGDTGIVKSEFGYHIMYFEGYAEDSVWVTTARNTLAQKDSVDMFEVKENEYTASFNAFGELFLQRDVDMR